MENINSTFISGIYNWCDRWCERCAFTTRCRVFEREKERDLKEPEDVWNALSENFKETLDMLHLIAEEHGIDLAQIAKDSEADTSLEEEDKRQDEHPLSVITNQYLFEGKDWIESSKLKDYCEELTLQVDLGMRQVSEVNNQVAKIEEALEVIQW